MCYHTLQLRQLSKSIILELSTEWESEIELHIIKKLPENEHKANSTPDTKSKKNCNEVA